MNPQSESNYRGTGCGKAARPDLKGSGEATNRSTWKFRPNFDFESHNIGIDAIQADADSYLRKFAEVDEEHQNPFPVEIFPLPIQQIIKSSNEGLNFPVDFTGVSMLYAVALAIGNTHRIQIKKGWSENVVLYIAIVGRPGTNKSHPLSFTLNPIEKKDAQAHKEYEDKKREYDRVIKMDSGQPEKQRTGETKKPVWQKFLISDFTPESLVEVHKYNKRGIGVYIDELASWFKNFNRYHNGSEQELWLSNWSGKPIKVDRKTSEPIYIQQPFIPVIGTIQNNIIDQLAKDSRTKNGFIDRILFAVPDNLIKPCWNDIEISPELTTNWQQIIFRLLNLEAKFDDNNNPYPQILKFSPDAWQELKQWQMNNTKLSEMARNEEIESICCKLEIYVIRLALILEMMFWACDASDKKAVSIETVKGAIRLIEYFRKTAIKIHNIISNPLDRLPTDKRNFYDSLPDTFITSKFVEIAAEYKISERTAKRFLQEKEFFEKVSRGEYEKRL